MKKLIITAAVIVVGIFEINAASIDWTLASNAWKTQPGQAYAPEGTPVWLIDSEYQDSIIAALKDVAVIDFSSDTWRNDVSALSGVLKASETTGSFGMVSQNRATSDILTHEEYYNYAVLLVDFGQEAIYYNVSDYLEEQAIDKSIDPIAEIMRVDFTKDEIDAGTGWQVAQTKSIPEPTSGLLMLIGMAGLALRRRRA